MTCSFIDHYLLFCSTCLDAHQGALLKTILQHLRRRRVWSINDERLN
jgi:hypothetical protein